MARQYNVNANQVFSWRRRFGAMSKPAAVAYPSSGLVSVAIIPEPENSGVMAVSPAMAETIETGVAGDCRIRVGADFDARALKRVLDVLRKR